MFAKQCFAVAYDVFQLVAENSPQENKILAVQKPDESLLIRLRGKLYQIQ